MAGNPEEVWECPKHPSNRRRNGICPVCLIDRLASLCPHCAKTRPCECADAAASSSSSTSSRAADGDPSLHRSRSIAIPFLSADKAPSRSPSFFSILRRNKTKRCDPAAEEKINEPRNEGFGGGNRDGNDRIDDFAKMITRSRSVTACATTMTSRNRPPDSSSLPAKGKFWHFPRPMTVFRGSKASKLVAQDRSPLHRG